jgi:hypothetical protein
LRSLQGAEKQSLQGQTAKSAANKAAGLCDRCGQATENGARECENCKLKRQKQYSQRSASRREEGACFLCGQAKLPGYARCQKCQTRVSRTDRARRQGYMTTKHLYIAKKTYGINVAVKPRRRLNELTPTMFVNMACDLELIKALS